MSHTVLKFSALGLLLSLLFCGPAAAQAGGNRVIFGDLRVDERQVAGVNPISFGVVLCGEGGRRLNHQTVNTGGRYRFFVSTGIYDIVVELEGIEGARV